MSTRPESPTATLKRLSDEGLILLLATSKVSSVNAMTKLSRFRPDQVMGVNAEYAQDGQRRPEPTEGLAHEVAARKIWEVLRFFQNIPLLNRLDLLFDQLSDGETRSPLVDLLKTQYGEKHSVGLTPTEFLLATYGKLIIMGSDVNFYYEEQLHKLRTEDPNEQEIYAHKQRILEEYYAHNDGYWQVGFAAEHLGNLVRTEPLELHVDTSKKYPVNTARELVDLNINAGLPLVEMYAKQGQVRIKTPQGLQPVTEREATRLIIDKVPHRVGRLAALLQAALQGNPTPPRALSEIQVMPIVSQDVTLPVPRYAS